MFWLILAGGFLLRLYNLGQVPPSLSLDEVSLGYNAYSIVNTGMDEYGTKFPMLLRAYDDWRPALYVYWLAPFIKLFGLNAWAVRLPSVILSLVVLVTTYFLGREFFRGYSGWSDKIPRLTLLVMVLLAISPWHIYLSRLSHEANLGLALVILGVYGFLCFVNRGQGKWLVFSTIVFSLSLASYQSQKAVVPVLLTGLWFLYFKELLKVKWWTLMSIILGGLIVLPVILTTISPQGLMRFRGTSAFAGEQSLMQEAAKRLYQAKKAGDLVGFILNQRYVVITRIFIANYFSHFNPNWLFIGGPFESHKVPGLGLLYWWEAPLIILGVITLLKTRENRKKTILLGLWLMSAPFPAAITTQAPHAMRAYTFLPVWQLLGGLGLISFWQILAKSTWQIVVKVSLGLGITLSFIYFLNQYYLVFPKTQSRSFQSALVAAVSFVRAHQDQYQQIIFSNQDNLYQSYMFYLFYTAYDPSLYLSQGGTRSGGFVETHKFGKFEFRSFQLKSEKSTGGKKLYVGNITDFPAGYKSLAVINYLNNEPAIKIVEN